MAELAPVLGRGAGELDGENVQRLAAAWRALPQRSRYIVTVGYGLAGIEKRTLRRAGDALGLQLSRVRQLQVAAVETLARATFAVDVREEAQRDAVIRALGELAVASRTR